jgi:hypothetical protein
MPFKNPEDRRRYNREYRKKHQKYLNEYDRTRSQEPDRKERLRLADKKRQHSAGRLSSQKLSKKRYREKLKNDPERYERTLEKGRVTMRALNQKRKLKVLTHYGLKCKCCGESEIKFLTIHHMNNDGKEHRKIIGNGSPIYRWLIENDFPSGFQVLCMNCNWAKGIYGECPHKEVK